jgi:hypothetical protein
VLVDLIFSHPGDIAPLSLPAPAAGALLVRALPAIPVPADPVSAAPLLDRVSRLAALGPEDTGAGLLWLAMNFPAVCDAMLDKTECDAIDDEESLCEEPEPYCTVCRAAAGIFTAHGDQWRHYRWDYAPGSKPEVFDAGHDPQIGWRPAPCPEPAAL